jgi:hypothetical protein
MIQATIFPGTGRGSQGYEAFPRTLTLDGGRWIRADLVAAGLGVSVMRVRRLLHDGRLVGRRAPVWYAQSASVEAYRRRRDALLKLLSA